MNLHPGKPTDDEQDAAAEAFYSVPAAQHGRDCPKVQHVGGGYLHRADDDRPYDVDGVAYCGRCHGWMGAVSPAQGEPK